MTGESPKRRFSQKTADFRRFTLSLKFQHLEGAGNADVCRKPKIFAANRRKPQIGLRHLRSVTFSSALSFVFRQQNPGAFLGTTEETNTPFSTPSGPTLKWPSSGLRNGGLKSPKSGLKWLKVASKWLQMASSVQIISTMTFQEWKS